MATVLATQSVAAINDPPIFALASTLVTVQEDVGAVSVNGFATTMAPGPASAIDEAGQTLTFLVTVMGTTESVSFEVAPSIDPVTGALTFTAAADSFGTATVEVLLRDDGSDVSPNISESSAHQFTIEVTATNDEQVLVVNTGLLIDQGAVATITSAVLETTDVDTSPDALLYTIVSGPTHGSVLVDGTPALQFTQAQVTAGLVSYQNDGTANLIDSFSFSVDDGEGTASTGTFGINITTHPGDYNRDLSVDAADYIVWRKSLGVLPVSSEADGNGDGVVDQGDYDVWRANFGNTTSGVASADVTLSEITSMFSESSVLDVPSAIVVENEGKSRTFNAEYGITRNIHGGYRSLDFPLKDVLGAIAQATRRTGLDVRAVVRASSTASSQAAHCDEAVVDWLELESGSRRQDDDIGRPAGDERDESAVDGEYENYDEVFALLGSVSL